MSIRFILIFLVACLLLHPALSFSQDAAIPKMQLDDSTVPKKWQGDIALGFNFTEGNSETTLLNFAGEAEREERKNIYRFKGSTSYGESDDEVDVDSSDVLLDYKRLLSDRWYGVFSTSFERDEIADLRYRIGLNPGIGVFIVKNPELRFALELGPSYVLEELDDQRDNFLAPRIGNRFEWNVSKTAKVYEELEVLVQADDTDNYYGSLELGIETAIVEALALRVSLEANYDNRPAEGKEERDTSLISSVVYKFGQ